MESGGTKLITILSEFLSEIFYSSIYWSSRGGWIQFLLFRSIPSAVYIHE